MKKIFLMSFLSVLTLTFGMNAYAKIYKWVDSKGVVHYSATPPKTKKIAKKKVKDIETKIRFAAGKSKTVKNKVKKKASKTNKVVKENNDSELSPPDQKLVDYCKTQKLNLAAIKRNFRNVWIDPSGKRTKLNQQQRQEKVDYLKSRIKQDCAEVNTETED